MPLEHKEKIMNDFLKGKTNHGQFLVIFSRRQRRNLKT